MCYNNRELEHTYGSLASSHFASRPPGHGMKHGDPFYLTSLTSERTPSSQVLLTPSSFLLVQCTVTCGGGVQTRSVHCVQQGRPSSSCLLRQKPPMLRACNTNFCPAPAKRGNKPCTPVTFTKSSESFPKLHRTCLCPLFLEQLWGAPFTSPSVNSAAQRHTRHRSGAVPAPNAYLHACAGKISFCAKALSY